MNRTQDTAAMQSLLDKMDLNSKAVFDQNDEKSSAKDECKTPSTTSSAPLGFLDLPAELRNKIYRLALVSNEPITLQYESLGTFDRCRFDMDQPPPTVSSEPTILNFESTGGIHERYRFTMLPNLLMVCKQLRLETQRLFLDENEFKVTHTLKQKSISPLLALDRLHSAAGTGLQTLHVYHEVWSKCYDGLFKLKANIAFSKVQGCIAITKQEYSSTYIGVLDTTGRLPTVGVCGCEMQRLVGEFNMSSGAHDIIPFLQNLKWTGGFRGSSSLSSRHVGGGAYHSTICSNCPRKEWWYMERPVQFRPFV